MTEEFYAAQERLDQAVRDRMRDGQISDYNKALNDLKAENDPAVEDYERCHPNDTARKSAFVARHVRDGYTRAEALDLWEREERRLSAATAGRGSMRLTSRHADSAPDIAVPID